MSLFSRLLCQKKLRYTSDIQAEEQTQLPLFAPDPAVTFQAHEKLSHCQHCTDGYILM